MPSHSAIQRNQGFQSWAQAKQRPAAERAGPAGPEAAPRSGEEFLALTQVYVLCIPKRRKHAEELLSRWGFHDVSFVDGTLKEDVDIQSCIRDGLVAPEYEEVIWQDLEYVPEGKVACHLGHLSILRAFLEDEKPYAMIFEDDLEDQSDRDVMRELLAFLSQVPNDFGLLHLGFVRENRAARRAVGSSGAIFCSAEALGRHAYVVTKQTARLLVERTVPMYNHGDKMFQDVYREYGVLAYQPREPLFYQDRVNFDSELTRAWKPSRAFQPTAEDDGIRECDRVEVERRQEIRVQKAQEVQAQLEQQLLQRPEEEQAAIRQMQVEGHDLRALLAPRPSAVLFLGLEGVFITESSQAEAESGRPETELLRHLAKVVDATGCSLVPTSSRCHDDRWLLRFVKALERVGVPRSSVAGCAAPERREHAEALTESELREARAQVIASWLAQNTDVLRWVVVDCLDLGKAFGGVFSGRSVRTDPRRGLRLAEVRELIARLGPRPCPEEHHAVR